MRKILSISILFLLVILYSCDKQKWKKPTEVSVVFDIQRSSDNYSYLEFTGGQLVLRSFVFDGLRVQADDVYFESEYEDGLLIDLNASQPYSEMIFDIPQGTYTTVRVNLELEKSDFQDLVLEGVYTNSGGQQIPLRLEYEHIEFYDKIALNIEGDQEIDLVNGVPSTATITFDPFYWFSSLSTTQLDDATITDVNGVQTLLINDDVNSGLLDIINEKVANKVKIIFQ